MRRKRILAGILILALLSLLLMAFYALIAAATNDQHDTETHEIGLRIASIWRTERPQETSKAETPPEPLTPAQTPASEDGSTVSAKPEAPVEVEITAQEPYQYENFRGVFHNEIYPQWMERQDWIDRVTHYCRCMGMNVSDEDIAYFTDLAIQGGYDPRLWCCIAMAESTGGRYSSNLYGFCGGSDSEWAYVPGSWRTQTEWLHNRITTFYVHSGDHNVPLDISNPVAVLWFHHEGDPAPANPRAELFYCDNVMRWLENI